jgi:16S rRNA (guanine527-N7)-methyltransferase
MSHSLWIELAGRASLALSPAQLDRADQYLQLLLEANQRINLTRITDRADAAVRHVGDSLTLLPFLPAGPHALADVGSGGGAPGLILAIARPDVRVTLIESTRKKAEFLRQTAASLQLGNVEVLAQRVEEVGRSERRETFDVATARAVGAMVWLVEWCLPLVKVGGKCLTMKGQKLPEEMPAAQKIAPRLGGGAPAVHAAALPGAEHHVIVEWMKRRPSDSRYPRLPTQAKSRPAI